MNSSIKLQRPLIVGILNATPDSFSDGGNASSAGDVCRIADKLISAGCDILEIGGESTRPGSKYVSEQEERERVLRTLDVVQSRFPQQPIGIDTRREELMIETLGRGAIWFNNVAGLCSDTTLKSLADRGSYYAAMHMHKIPENMQTAPLGVALALSQVSSFFSDAQSRLLSSGFTDDKIFLDPGIGFGKSDAANFALMSHVGEWSKSYNILMGISRKSFIGRMSGIDVPKDRDTISKAFEVSLIAQGSRAIRTHDVKLLVSWASKVWDWNDERRIATNFRMGDS